MHDLMQDDPDLAYEAKLIDDYVTELALIEQIEKNNKEVLTWK